MAAVLVKSRLPGGFYRCGTFFPSEGLVVDPANYAPDWHRIEGDPNLRIEPIEAALDPREALIGRVIGAISEVPGDAFTKAGPPKVDAIRAVLPDLADQIDVALVAEAWEQARATAEEDTSAAE